MGINALPVTPKIEQEDYLTPPKVSSKRLTCVPLSKPASPCHSPAIVVAKLSRIDEPCSGTAGSSVNLWMDLVFMDTMVPFPLPGNQAPVQFTAPKQAQAVTATEICQVWLIVTTNLRGHAAR